MSIFNSFFHVCSCHSMCSYFGSISSFAICVCCQFSHTSYMWAVYSLLLLFAQFYFAYLHWKEICGDVVTWNDIPVIVTHQHFLPTSNFAWNKIFLYCWCKATKEMRNLRKKNNIKWNEMNGCTNEKNNNNNRKEALCYNGNCNLFFYFVSFAEFLHFIHFTITTNLNDVSRMRIELAGIVLLHNRFYFVWESCDYCLGNFLSKVLCISLNIQAICRCNWSKQSIFTVLLFFFGIQIMFNVQTGIWFHTNKKQTENEKREVNTHQTTHAVYCTYS